MKSNINFQYLNSSNMKRTFTITLLLLLMIVPVFAIEINPVKKGTDALLYQTCNNCTYCNISSVVNNNGTILLGNTPFIENGTYYSYILDSNYTNEIGQYTYCYDCGNSQNKATGCIDFDVTFTGKQLEISDSIINIIFLLFFVACFVGFYNLSQKVDFKKWHSKMVNQYQDRNWVNAALSTIAYTFVKNTFLIYYLLGFPVIIIITSLVQNYNISTFLQLMETITYVYSWAVVIVGVMFLGKIQELIKMTWDLAKDQDWGIN